MLQLSEVETFYGISQILFRINLDVKENEIVTLLGRNGVGKSTIAKTIMGLLIARSGIITFKEEKLVGKPPHYIARLGIGYVPQGRHIFASLTTHENLLVPMRKGKRKNDGWTVRRVFELFPILGVRQNERAQHLSGGEQQMLVIG